MASNTALSTQRVSGSSIQSGSTSVPRKIAKPFGSAVSPSSSASSKSHSRSKSDTYVTPSPGRWRHPTFDEITKRRRRTTFDESNLRGVTINGLALIASFWWATFVGFLPSNLYNVVVVPIATSTSYWTYILLTIRCLLVFNIFRASRPLFLPPDNATDIDLNPRQRSLFGLDPKATPPPTSKTRYITPPKYPRSTSSTPGSSGSNISTPSSNPLRAPYSLLRHASDSNSNPISVSNSGSPLWKRTVEERHSSLGLAASYNSPLQLGGPGSGRVASSGGPLPESYIGLDRPGSSPNSSWRLVPTRSPSRRMSNSATPPSSKNTVMESGSVFAPNTPSPVGRGASVPLNSRWLYERGRNGETAGNVGYS